jgi:hypothetical protein
VGRAFLVGMELVEGAGLPGRRDSSLVGWWGSEWGDRWRGVVCAAREFGRASRRARRGWGAHISELPWGVM